MPALPLTGGNAPGRGPSGGLGRPTPVAPAPPVQAATAPVAAVDPVLAPIVAPALTPAPAPTPAPNVAVDAAKADRNIVSKPSLSDPLIWVSPRPALPAEVADKLYRPRESDVPLPRDTIVVRRLRAMVDSMNRIIDADQRAHRRPSWTTDVAGKKFGMDSANIYIAGIKIPTAVLMAFGPLVPQGNYDEAMRIRQLDYLREDMMQAAARTQNLEEFRSYVRELRQRKQRERDFDRHQRDTVVGVPEKVVP